MWTVGMGGGGASDACSPCLSVLSRRLLSALPGTSWRSAHQWNQLALRSAPRSMVRSFAARGDDGGLFI